jgi:hypothetical protein
MTDTASPAATSAWTATGSSDAYVVRGVKPARRQASPTIRNHELLGAPPIHDSRLRSPSSSGRLRRASGWPAGSTTLNGSSSSGIRHHPNVTLAVVDEHDPDADQGFVGAALSSNVFRFHRTNGSFQAEPVIEVDNVELEGWPLPGGVPGLITDLVVSMDDRFLYFSNWLHGDLSQYDISDPANPRLTGRLWLGGLLGKPTDAGRELNGGPQMIQLSLDGRRLYVTNSLYSTWDNQFYPELRSWLLRVNCSPDGGMEIDPDFFVDLHDRPGGPARAHEVRLQGGDCTTEIFQ